ncbi:MAG: hypothetical protein R6V83_04145 [Candidatus Thorarchaeota archaeon]
MTVVKGTIREILKSDSRRVATHRWYAYTDFVLQNGGGKTYRVRLSSKTMKRCNFLPRAGIDVILDGYVETAEYGLSDYFVSRVKHIRRKDSDIRSVHKPD